MTIKRVALILLCLMTGTAMAQEPKVISLMSKDLPESPGREALMITVEHAPGGSSAIHRHNAHAFVYVLEGSVVMQLKGGQQVTLTPGQTFYEGPDDVHVVDRNASAIVLDQGQGCSGARASTVTVEWTKRADRKVYNRAPQIRLVRRYCRANPAELLFCCKPCSAAYLLKEEATALWREPTVKLQYRKCCEPSKKR